MSSIDDLRKKVQSLQDQLADAKEKLHTAELDACKIKIGMIVRGRDRKSFDGKIYRIVDVDVRWKDKPWIVGVPKRADGSWGTARRNLFDHYEVVEG